MCYFVNTLANLGSLHRIRENRQISTEQASFAKLVPLYAPHTWGKYDSMLFQIEGNSLTHTYI
jgi:hypothetical protein